MVIIIRIEEINVKSRSIHTPLSFSANPKMNEKIQNVNAPKPLATPKLVFIL